MWLLLLIFFVSLILGFEWITEGWGRGRGNVQVTLNVSGLNLRCQSQGVEQVLTQGRRSRSLLVNDRLNVAGNTVDHAQNILNRTLQSLDISEDVGTTLLSITGRSNSLQTTLLGLTVADLVRDGDEGGAVGGSLRGHTDGGGDVGASLDVLSSLGGDGQVNGRVRPCAITLAAVEVLDQSGKGVQLGRGGVPTHEHFLGVGLQVQRKHLLLVFHVHFNLVCRLRVSNSEGAADFHLGSILGSGSQQSTDDTLLVSVATEGVVQDREECLAQRVSTMTLIEEKSVRPSHITRTWGWMTTFRGAVVGAVPTATGPRGRAR